MQNVSDKSPNITDNSWIYLNQIYLQMILPILTKL